MLSKEFHLGYSINGSPFGMVLEKELEYYIDLKKDNISIPLAVYPPGRFFLAIILAKTLQAEFTLLIVL